MVHLQPVQSAARQLYPFILYCRHSLKKEALGSECHADEDAKSELKCNTAVEVCIRRSGNDDAVTVMLLVIVPIDNSNNKNSIINDNIDDKQKSEITYTNI